MVPAKRTRGYDTDRLLLALAAVSLGVLGLLAIAHSPWALALFVILPSLWYRGQRAMAAERTGALQLNAAVTALLCQDEPAARWQSGSARRVAPRLRLISEVAE
jgi:hypothetical protein